MSELYGVVLMVEPRENHPAFFLVKRAGITACLFADSEEEALSRVESFADVARWKSLQCLALGLAGTIPDHGTSADLAALARADGFAFLIRKLERAAPE